MRRVSRQEAAAIKEVSEATIDRWVKSGKLPSEREPHGSSYRVLILLDDDDGPESSLADNRVYATADGADNAADTAGPGVYSPDGELAALRAENRQLRELADYHRKLLDDAEWRYRELLEQFKVSNDTVSRLTKALPLADTGPSRRWWPFGGKQRGKV